MLDQLRGPQDVTDLDAQALAELAAKIRRRAVETVARTGRPLGSHLGVVEPRAARRRKRAVR